MVAGMVNGAGQRSQGSFCHFPQGPQVSTTLQGSHCHTHINGRRNRAWTLAGVLPFLKWRTFWLRSSSAHFLFYLIGQDGSLSMGMAQGHLGGAATSSLTLLPISIVGSRGCCQVLFQEIRGTAGYRTNLGDYSFQESVDKKCLPGLCFQNHPNFMGYFSGSLGAPQPHRKLGLLILWYKASLKCFPFLSACFCLPCPGGDITTLLFCTQTPSPPALTHTVSLSSCGCLWDSHALCLGLVTTCVGAGLSDRE